MKFEKIKNTDIEVSKICLGGMSFGKAGSMHDWTLDERSSERIIKHALNNNINFFDTANGYSKGTGEEYLGKALKNNISRNKVIIASKVYFNPGRLSRKAIFREIEGSLKRLGTDYLDFYIIHRFDYETPIEETMEALNDLVKSGKVRAIGASAMYGYQFQKMQNIAEKNNWVKFTVMENHYNLLYREDERELIPICIEQTDLVAKGKYDHTKKFDLEIVNRVNNISTKYDVSMSQIALAWQWAKGISSPIIGATKEKYIDDAINALDLTLTKSDIEYLEQPYVPHKIIGAIDKNPPEGVVLLNVDKNK